MNANGTGTGSEIQDDLDRAQARTLNEKLFRLDMMYGNKRRRIVLGHLKNDKKGRNGKFLKNLLQEIPRTKLIRSCKRKPKENGDLVITGKVIRSMPKNNTWFNEWGYPIFQLKGFSSNMNVNSFKRRIFTFPEGTSTSEFRSLVEKSLWPINKKRYVTGGTHHLDKKYLTKKRLKKAKKQKNELKEKISILNLKSFENPEATIIYHGKLMNMAKGDIEKFDALVDSEIHRFFETSVINYRFNADDFEIVNETLLIKSIDFATGIKWMTDIPLGDYAKKKLGPDYRKPEPHETEHLVIPHCEEYIIVARQMPSDNEKKEIAIAKSQEPFIDETEIESRFFNENDENWTFALIRTEKPIADVYEQEQDEERTDLPTATAETSDDEVHGTHENGD